MKRLFALLILLGSVAGLSAQEIVNDAVETWAPVKIIKPNGVVISSGVTANTDASRGAAFKRLRAQAAAGDRIVTYANATSDVPPTKAGVRFEFKDGAVYTNTANVPAITIADLSTANNVLYRGRQASLYCPEPELCLWDYQFATDNNYANTVFSSGGPTLTIAAGSGTYSAGAGATSATFIASRRPPTAQYTFRILVDALNAPGNGATYNDLLNGFALTTTSTSDTVQYKIGMIYRRTEALNQIFCHYEWSGGSVETTPVAITETQPFYLVYVINHNSATAAIERLDGTWRIVDHQEITLAHQDMEDQATVAKMRPLLYWQSNGGQTNVVRDWSVRCMGSLGRREHMVARYENGQPIRSPDGYYYVSADACGPTTASAASPVANSAFMRNCHAVYQFDANTGRMQKCTAKHSMKVSGRVFGTQEGYVMHDRATGLWHYYCAEWNYSGGGAVKLYHGSTYQNLLTCGHKVWEQGELTQIDVSALAGFSGQAVYSSNVRNINGTWYLAGTVTQGSAPVRRLFLISDDNPDFSSPAMVWICPDVAGPQEGGYLWHTGTNWYVAGGINSNTVKAYAFANGAEVYSHNFPGGGGYDQFMDLLEHVEGGRTRYLWIAFSDTDNGTAGRGEDFYDGTTNNNLAFGSDIVIDGGWQTGEQYTDLPNP